VFVTNPFSLLNVNGVAAQTGFIDWVLMPLFEAWDDLVGGDSIQLKVKKMRTYCVSASLVARSGC
jgi:hypothetical protein